MISNSNIKARLYITYLKGMSELLLYIKPHRTHGRTTIYRRSPGDAAMNLRIQSLLDHSKLLRSQIEIWVMLYPPEIQTCTLYTPKNMTQFDLREQIREQILVNLPYSINYDWEHYLTRVEDNGGDTDMVTVTIIGKSVLPRVKALLYKNFSKVTFIGDGLQFLAADEGQLPFVRGRFYQVILPYDEIYYLAGFRSGRHISSCALTHANSAFFGRYRLDHQQVYLDCPQGGSSVDWPRIQPLVDRDIWNEELLTPAAFPAWHIARQSITSEAPVNFIAQASADEKRTSPELKVLKNYYGYWD
jgi:hypothetical protein